MNGAASIETRGLTKTFGTFTAVDAIDVSVKRGEIFGFLGANGAGKTTAIRMLCGLLTPSSGAGKVAGFDIMRQGADIRTRIGYMAQKFSLYPDLTLEQNMRLYGSLYGLPRRELRDRIDKMAEQVGLSDKLSRKTQELPLGWQQRLSLACANLHRPEILFLDEPTGSVDPLSRRRFWDMLHSLSQAGTTIFVTTHYMDEAEYCHRISLMASGRIAAEGSPAELKSRLDCASLQDVFLKVMQKEARLGNGQAGERK